MSSEPTSDLASYPSPNLAVDLVLITICDGALRVLMMERQEEPFAGRWVLPGGFVHPREMLDDTARRVLGAKTGLADLPVEQLYSFSSPERDPRGWVVSVAYLALVPSDRLLAAIGEGRGLRLVEIAVGSGSAGRVAPLGITADGEPVEPGFDHREIVTVAVERLQGKLDWSMVAFGFLPEEFTLFELQRVHELILGRGVNKPHFRKKMLDRTFPDGRGLGPTGRFSRGGRHRPAELYRLEAAVS